MSIRVGDTQTQLELSTPSVSQQVLTNSTAVASWSLLAGFNRMNNLKRHHRPSLPHNHRPPRLLLALLSGVVGRALLERAHQVMVFFVEDAFTSPFCVTSGSTDVNADEVGRVAAHCNLLGETMGMVASQEVSSVLYISLVAPPDVSMFLPKFSLTIVISAFQHHVIYISNLLATCELIKLVP
ncbi:hypothetical protein BDR07DRAFT_1610125 [Suillus spraguei]|nr:hypothetical protein BDR07DRAFT_1610125 [Suillus spraguei]